MLQGQVWLIIAIFVWLIVLSFFVGIFHLFLRKLSALAGQGDLKKTLGKLLEISTKNSEDVVALKKLVSELDEVGMNHLQKTGLVKFNPFQETGGDNSFSIALLTGLDNGIIITGLHTRERTRIYIKRIEKGKSEHELSAEEKKALNKAIDGK